MASTKSHLEKPLRRRDFLKAGALAAAGAALPTACTGLPSFLGGRRRHPNIILVFTDDQAFDAIDVADYALNVFERHKIGAASR